MRERSVTDSWSIRALGGQLALLTAVCIVTGISVFGVFLARDYVRAVERDVIESTTTTLHQVASSILPHLLVRDYVSVERHLLVLDPVPGFRDIYVISPQGAIISHVAADGSGFLRAQFRQESVELPRAPKPEQIRRGELLETWRPINQGEMVGWVRMISDLGAVYAKQREIYTRTAIAGFVATALSLAVLYIFLAPRVAALSALTSYAQRYRTGTTEPPPVYRGSSDIEALGSSMRDAAARIVTDAQLLRSRESQLRTVVEHMPVLMNAFDESARFIVWNKECERVTGYAAAEIIGNPNAITLLYPDPHYREAMMTAWRERGGSFRDWELTLTAKDGSQKTIAWSNLADEFPIPGWSSWSIGIDITQLRENERLKDEFVSTVNHELRTPLSAIHGSLRLMMNDVVAPLPESVRQLVDVAERNCARLTRLISNVLDIQRMEAGDVSIATHKLDLGALVSEAIDVNAPYGLLRETRLIFENAMKQPVAICGDKDKLMQVLTNLLSNAIKFSPPRTTVHVGLVRESDQVTISVRDQGPGIPDEFAGKMFQRFSRATSGSTQATSGSGLGLYISKSIVEHHGGRLTFQNNAAGGATFSVSLPVHENVNAESALREA